MPPFPPVYGIVLETELAAVFFTKLPLFTAEEQVIVEIVPIGRFTVLLKEHVTPPIFISKFAVPLDEGVPVIANVKLPFPLAKLPDEIEAVNPVTLVDVIDNAPYVPPFPPE